MRIKNLDTGEEYDLESYGFDVPGAGHSSDSHSDPHGAQVEGAQPKDAGGKRKGWLKGTKKLKNWAKSTLSNVRERINERIDKPPPAQWQPPPWPQEPMYDDGAEASVSSAGGSVAPRQFSDAVWAPLQPPHAAGADRPAALGPGPGSLQGNAIVFGPLTAALRERASADALRASAAAPCLPVSYGAAASADTGPPYGSAAAAAAGRGSPTPGAAGRSWRHPSDTADTAEAVLRRTREASSSGVAGQAHPRSSPAAAEPMAPSPASRRADAASMSVGSGRDGGSPSAQPDQPDQPERERERGGRLPSATTGGPPAAPASGGVEYAELESLEAAGPGGSEASLSAAEEAGEAGEAEGEAGELEVDVPLLREDAVGPSSRAVPASRSWLHQPARVVGRRAAHRQLQQVRMVQEVAEHEGAVWALRFSGDARLMASGGRDGVLRIWAVYWYAPGRSKLISPTSDYTDTSAYLPASSPPSSSAPSASAPAPSAASAAERPAPCRPLLLSESPLLALPGHRGDLLDLSWSQCRLLLTASADQTARLWHIDVGLGGGGGGGGEAGGAGDGRASGGGGGRRSRDGGAGGGGGGGGCPSPSGECLRSFVHPDFVTSCCFHPTDPRRIVTGCADGKIRVWSVPEGSVLAAATVPQDVITRVLFSADASRVVAGTLRGKARHYEYSAATGSLEYLSQVDVKNTHGSGRKVTGLAQVPYIYGNDQLYVITSADSRIRLYVGYVQERKFKGHRHTNTQIAASLSPSCQHIVCGSDDGWVYVWETGLPPPSAAATATPSGAAAAAGAGSVSAGASARGGSLAGAAAGGGGAAGGRRGVASAASSLRSLGGGGKVKEGTYEAFQTPEQTTTVAVFAPDVCRLGRGLERPAGSAEGGAYAGGGAGAPGPAAAASPLLGSLFVVGGFSGRIYVYENLPPQFQAQAPGGAAAAALG